MKRFSMLALLAFVCIPGYGCDFCGCAAGNQYLGILPQADKSFVGLQYQYNQFSTNHPAVIESNPDEHSNDAYHTLQAWGRYHAGKRLQLFAFVPLHYNIHEEDGVHMTNSGLGDISLLANFLIIKENEDKEAWRQSLLAGGGIKLPTGKYSGITSLDRQGLPNMQAGTGSWDFILNANYTLRKEKFGFNAEASYTLTTANRDKYKYGNRLSSGLLGFYSLKLKQLTLLPQAGVRYEYTLHDYDNYSRKWLNEQSGGYMCFGSLGVQAYYKNIGGRLSYQVPVSQEYGSGYVTALRKMEAGVFLIF